MSYYFPAEWSPQQAILITWPDEGTVWHDYLDQIEPVFIQFARAILTYQKLIIVCRNDKKQQYIKGLIGETTYPLHFLQVDYNDLWIRDYGPISLTNGEDIQWLDFAFNAWGGKYGWQHDDKVSENLFNARLLQHIHHYKRQDLILEGGAIETDGLGTVLTTACAFTKTRNANLTESEIAEKIRSALHAKRLIVIQNGYLSGDDTDGHVDTLVRFCNPETIAYTTCDDKDDVHYAVLKAMEEEVKQLTTLEGKPYKLIPLPIPSAKFDDTARRLPASYANFLIINGAVLCPTYDDANDAIMLERLHEAFPAHQLIPIPCLPLIQYNGALHCASMQIPTV